MDGIYYHVNKKDNDERIGIRSNWIYTEFTHKNFENLKYGNNGSNGITVRPVRTGPYTAKSYLRTPDNTYYPITNEYELMITQWRDQDYVFKSLYGRKSIRLAVFGECNDLGNNLQKIQRYKIIRNFGFAESASGTVGQYFETAELRAESGGKMFEIGNLLDGLNLYYSIGETYTNSWSGSAWPLHLYKLKNDDYNLDDEYLHLNGINSINYSELNESYEDIFENGKFKVDNLKNGGTYVLVLDRYYISVNLQIRDSRHYNSSLNYNIYIYDSNDSLFSSNIDNTGSWDLGTIVAGRYKIKVYYQGIDVTPSAFNNVYQNWFSDMGTVCIDLDIPLQSFSSTLVYPGPSGTLLSSYCDLGVNVTKLTNYDGTIVDSTFDPYYGTEDELTYYFRNRNGQWRGNSHKDVPWSSGPNGLELYELMPGLYKIKIFYHYFLNNIYDRYGGGYGCGRFYKSYNRAPSFPLTIPKSDLRNICETFNEIEHLDLVLVHEYVDWHGGDSWRENYRFTTGSYEMTEDGDNLIITKKPGAKTLEDWMAILYPNGVNQYSRTFTLVFGDLLKTMYILVNENGIKEIQENELPNYNTLKNETEGMNSSTLGTIQLPYVYLDSHSARVTGYPWSLHCNNATRLKMTGDDGFVYYNRHMEYSGWRDTYINYIDYYPTSYAVKSGHEYNYKYMRGSYILGESSTYLYREEQQVTVNAVNIGSFNGTIINKSLNRPVSHQISYWLYEEYDDGNENFTNDTTLYYDGSIDASSSGIFNFTGLFLNSRIKVNLMERSPDESYPPVIKMISGNITEDIEVPYEMYTITIEYRNNKNPDSNNLTTMPTSGFTLVRNQGDEYDKIYKFGSGTSTSLNLRSGKYTGIIFEDVENNVKYEYEDFVLNKNIKFTFRMYCERALTTVNLGSNEYDLRVYDEQGNLYLKKTPTDVDGIIGPLILMNVTYTFTRINHNGDIINSITKKLNLEEETIDLTQS